MYSLRTSYKEEFISDTELGEIGFLIKKGIAKHKFNEKIPALAKIKKMPNSTLPKRDETKEG